ncbi:protease complex subunit PrcB family protein [Marinobacter salicampi]|uniref:protease complex subunit PrcB family protein n=1 Tax=Marinobacter salicampi TaxID=435907 RepID=UPI001408B498|nr:protease complex subunit PrcB family protein [Marinobacter salicampi]
MKLSPVSARRFPLLVFASLLLSACASSETPPVETETGGPVARQVTESDHCGLTAPGLVYLESRQELEQFKRLPGQNLSLTNGLDFDREHLVVVGLGRKPTGGHGVTLASSDLHNGVMRLAMEVFEPGPDRVVTQAITTPCAVVAVSTEDWDTLKVIGQGLPEMTRRR